MVAGLVPRKRSKFQVQCVLRPVASALFTKMTKQRSGAKVLEVLASPERDKLKVHSFLLIETGLRVAQASLKFIRLPRITLNPVLLPQPLNPVLECQMCAPAPGLLFYLH